MPSDLFAALSTELIYMILGRLDHPQDLYSVIRASPHVLGCFGSSKEIILKSVVKNCFSHMVLADAIVAARFLPENQRSIDAQHDRQQRPAILTRTIREMRATPEPEVTVDESIELCRLYPSLNYFIKDCSENFLATARREANFFRKSNDSRTKSLVPPANNERLSPLELARLQRAFVRYLTLQTLLHAPEPEYHNSKVSEEPVAALLGEYAPWEVEEIACVHQYIISLLEDVFEDVENYFVFAVATTERPSTSRYLPEGNSAADLDSLEAEAAFCDPEVWMFMDHEKRYHPQTIEHLATFGFQFLRALLEADNTRRTTLINENYKAHYSNMGDALKHPPRQDTAMFRRERDGERNFVKLDFEGDEYEKRNLAWLWSNQYRPQYGYSQTCNLDLRAWGYVFWDKGRLDRLGILKEERPPFHCTRYPPHYRKPAIKPSAQKRLRELGLA